MSVQRQGGNREGCLHVAKHVTNMRLGTPDWCNKTSRCTLYMCITVAGMQHEPCSRHTCMMAASAAVSS